MVHWAQRYFLNLMKAVAPEKREEVERIVRQRTIVFVLDADSDRVLFTARSGSRPQITVGIKCIGRLWAHAYAYFCVYTDVASHIVDNPESRELDLRGTKRLRRAGDVLRWAVLNEIRISLADAGNYAVEALPAGLPVPFGPSDRASDADVSDELCLMALGFILLHELAHIVLGHEYEEGYVSIEQEKTADRFAANWLLDAPGISGNARLKRILGISVGLGWLASIDVYLGAAASSTHPPGYDRLYQILDQFEDDDNGLVWAFIMTALGLHLQNQSVPLALDREYPSFKEVANHYVDAISHLDRPTI